MKVWHLSIIGFLCPIVLGINWPHQEINELVDVLNKTEIDSGKVIDPLKMVRNFDEKLCRRQIQSVFDAAKQRDRWALKVMDSWGQLPPNGLLWGRYADLGNFDECLSVVHLLGGDDGIFMGQYCIAKYPIAMITPKSNKRIRKPRMFVDPIEPSAVMVGVCVPDTCSAVILDDIFRDLFYNHTNNTIDSIMFNEIECTRQEKREFNGLDFFAIGIYGTIGFLIFLSTIYDVTMERRSLPKSPLLVSFSVITNTRKLFHMENKVSSIDNIECLNGIRCLSIIWIIYGHTLMTLNLMPTNNTILLWKRVSEYYSMIFLNGSISVDTFFVLSGFLVTFHVYKIMDKTGNFNWKKILLMYLHRYLRLFPIFAATILFAVTLYKYIGSGPYWNTVNMAVEAPCRAYWWSALLHLQNYVNSSAMCLGHTWYLSTDTQLYILSPLILIPLRRCGRKVIIILIVLIVASCSYIFAIMIINDFSMKLLQGGLFGNNDKKVLIYYGLHTRAPTWLIGLLLGHFVYLNRGRKFELSKSLVLAGWIGSLAVMVAIIWGPYSIQQQFAAPRVIESAFYESCSRVSWALALSWVIFACYNGYGGIINSILSYSLWQPLSRLTYTIYIIHLVEQTTIVGLTRTEFYFDQFLGIRAFWSDFGVILTISILMVLAFESPFIALERHFLGGSERKNLNSRQNLTAISTETLESGQDGIKSRS